MSQITHGRKPLIIFGGTFDPIHFGHLRLAENLHNLLPSAEIRLMPNATPPHREHPGATSEQRLSMLKLAIASSPHLSVDEREIRREGASYTVFSIQELRKEFPERPLLLVMGEDAIATFHEWYCWQEITQLAHVIVVSRPGHFEVSLAPEVKAHLTEFGDIHEMLEQKSGGIFRYHCPLLDISASQIRQLITEKRSSRFLLPETVIEYIDQQELYLTAERQSK